MISFIFFLGAIAFSEPSTGAVDMSTVSLGRGYIGDSPAAVFNEIRTEPKNEFETSQEYSQRSARVPNEKRVAAFTHWCATSFDADSGSLKIWIPSGADHGAETYFSLASSTKVAGSRTVQNAFGAIWEITETVEHSYVFATPRLPDIATSMPVDAATARRIKKDVALILVCQLRHGDSVSQVQRTEATFEAPTEREKHTHIMRGELLSLWVYDTESGAVLKKLDVVNAGVTKELREVYSATISAATASAPAKISP